MIGRDVAGAMARSPDRRSAGAVDEFVLRRKSSTTLSARPKEYIARKSRLEPRESCCSGFITATRTPRAPQRVRPPARLAVLSYVIVAIREGKGRRLMTSWVLDEATSSSEKKQIARTNE